MTINRQWQHVNSSGQSNGVAVGSGAAVSGDKVVTGGGWGEIIKSDNSNESSTDTTGNTESGYCPLVAAYPVYDAVGGNTYLYVAAAVPPGVRVRLHIMTVWET